MFFATVSGDDFESYFVVADLFKLSPALLKFNRSDNVSLNFRLESMHRDRFGAREDSASACQRHCLAPTMFTAAQYI
jgi:hypothetical protein